MGSLDAELLALGKELAGGIAESLPLQDQNDEMGWAAHELAWSRGRGPTREEVKQFLPELKKAEIETGWGPVSRAEFAAGKGVARLVRQIERYFPTTIGVWPLSHWLRPTSSSVGVWSKDEEISYE